jgi:HNH endonuclease
VAVFRQIPSYPDYEVSTGGIVRRLTAARGTWPGRVRATPLDSEGYPTISVGHRPAIPVRVHLLVAEAWIGPIPPGAEVHHRNGKRADPRASNLVITASKLQHLEQHRGPNSRQRNYGEANPVVACACGCGQSLRKFDNYGRPREFISGHNMKAGIHG